MSVSVKPLPDVISSQIVPFESIYFLALLNMQNPKAYIYYNVPHTCSFMCILWVLTRAISLWYMIVG